MQLKSLTAGKFNSLIYRTRGTCPTITACLSLRCWAAHRLTLYLPPHKIWSSKANSLSLFTFFVHSNLFLKTATTSLKKELLPVMPRLRVFEQFTSRIALTKPGFCQSLSLKHGICIKPFTDGRSRCLACLNYNTCSAWKNWQVDRRPRNQVF